MEQIVTAGTALIEVFLCIWFAYGGCDCNREVSSI